MGPKETTALAGKIRELGIHKLRREWESLPRAARHRHGIDHPEKAARRGGLFARGHVQSWLVVVKPYLHVTDVCRQQLIDRFLHCIRLADGDSDVVHMNCHGSSNGSTDNVRCV